MRVTVILLIATVEVVPLQCRGMYTIGVNTGTIAAAGTTPHTATIGFSHLRQAISQAITANRHYSTGTVEGPLTYYY